MANGEMLAELRKLSEVEGRVPTSTALRLILSSMADLYERVDRIVAHQGTCEEEDKLMSDKTNEKIDQIISTVEGLRSQVNGQNEKIETIDSSIKSGFSDIDDRFDDLKENPMVAIGNFIKNHPKMFYSFLSIVTLLVVFLANLWFISGFRKAVLLLLDIPPEIIDMLVP